MRSGPFARFVETCLVAVLLGATLANAQVVATRELPPDTEDSEIATMQRAEPRMNQSCPSITVSQIDRGAMPLTTGFPPRVDLTLASVTSTELHVGYAIAALLRLKNWGPQAITIPWGYTISAAGPPIPAAVDNGREQKYSSAVAELAVEFKAAHDALIVSRLYSSTAQPGSELILDPGRSAELRLSGTVACAISSACTPLVSFEHAYLIASWNEHVYTRRREGCSVTYNQYEVRQLRSQQVPVQIKMDNAPSTR
jgi:hypothetical protein